MLSGFKPILRFCATNTIESRQIKKICEAFQMTGPGQESFLTERKSL